jgi:hypothetical protein
MNLNQLFAVVFAVMFSAPAFAAGVDRRACHQQARIVEGMRSGELTGREALRLEGREARVQREIARDRADGNFSLRERVRVQRQENRVSRDIYRQKHDAQVR